MAYEDFALEVIDEMPEAPDKEISLILISVIIQVISSLIAKCILDRITLNRPGFFKRMQLWNYVNQIGKAEGLDRQKREEAYDAMLKRGQKATQEDVDRLLAQAGN